MLSLTTFVLALPLLAQGRVVKIDGTSVSGTITIATVKEVSLKSGGKDVTIPPNEVLRLKFGPAPSLMAQAEACARRLEFQNAVNLYGEAADAKSPGWVAPAAKLGRAEALLGWSEFDAGHATDTVSAFREWIASYPDHIWLPRARMGLAMAMAIGGKGEDAANEMQDLANFAFEKNLGKLVEFAARLTRSKVYLKTKQPALAKQRLDGPGGLVAALEKATKGDSPAAMRGAMHQQWQQAQILLGDAIEQGDGLDAAKSYWEKVLRSSAKLGGDAQAAGQIVIAQAARKAGKLREAQFALAEVAALLNTGAETSARALFALGEVCTELDDKPTPGKVYFQRIIDLYPASTWAGKARKKLGL